MIIQALSNYYELLLKDPDIDIPMPGYSKAKVKFTAILSKEGDLLDLIPAEGKGKADWDELTVPEQKKRASGIFPYFVCDNSKYVFGWNFDKNGSELNQKYFDAFKELHETILEGQTDDKSQAILKFLQKWSPEDGLAHKVIQHKREDLEKSKGGLIAFKLDFAKEYLHEDQAILKAWKKYNKSSETDEIIAQCLVTGEVDTIERIHPGIKGVRDTNAAGATLVGVNAKAFESYQKTQGYNSPISKSAAFAYTTALNHLLKTPKQQIQLGDATTVFWSDVTGGACENLANVLFGSAEDIEEANSADNSKTLEYVKGALECLKSGKPLNDNADANFFILGLSPNNARVSVRFWYKDTFGNFAQKLWQHHQDMEIINAKRDITPLRSIIYETIPKNATKKEATPLLSGALMTSILTGTAYPQGLFYSIINRIRADGEINDVRAGIIKAMLRRNARLQKDESKERMITVGLDKKNPNVAYRLGRLFSVLEKAQRDAAEGIKLNTTIKDRFFGTASASPRTVFPLLMRLGNHHISKARYGGKMDGQIEEILQGINEFPAHFNSEEQGLFILGYYHQREANYEKNEETNQEGNKQ